MAELQVVVLGRIGIDFYPRQRATALRSVTSFNRFLGGSAANVAVAAARLGLSTALVTKVGRDPFGDFAREECERLGVDSRWISVHPQLATPLAFAEIHPPDHFPLVFYRSPSAPDELITTADLDVDQAAATPLVWTTGGSLSNPTTRATAMSLLARASGPHVVHDVDLRPSLWPSLDEAKTANQAAIAYANVVVGNRAEVELVTGTSEPVAAAEALMNLGVRLAIVKCGPDGALFVTPDAQHFEPAVATKVVNGLGAGDAFGGALCWGLLTGQTIQLTAHLAAAAGSIVAGRLACAESMPTLPELLSTIGVAEHQQ